ncbi:MAG: hypothetical protein RIC29_15465 [Rhodospirillaceae bacterium]
MRTTQRRRATPGEMLREEFIKPLGLTQTALTQTALAEATP